MNDHLSAFVLGLVQGVTEFLPISSSGHLVLAKHLLPGWEAPGIMFEAMLHVATLLSICLFYRNDLAALLGGLVRGRKTSRQYVAMLVVGSIPTAIIGLGFQDRFEAWFSSPSAVAWFLFGTALLLVWAARNWWLAAVPHVGIKDALLIGIFQGLAIAPGISRSGATFAAALSRGIEPAYAARFSFFLSVPAVAGAALLKFLEGGVLPPASVTLVGMATAAISGYLAIGIFVGTLVRGRFAGFAFYCAALGLLTHAFT